jgi:tRNA G46 methylase TrmB
MKTGNERWKKYYYSHHEYHLNRSRKYYLERMFEWYEWFERNGRRTCVVCGFDKHPKAIDFHHRDPTTKVFGIGKFINGRQCNEENQKVVLEEIEKCDCLCANCHRIEHFLIANGHTDKS